MSKFIRSSFSSKTAIILCLLLVGLYFVMVGCNKGGGEATPAPVESPAGATGEPTVAGTGETTTGTTGETK